MGTLPGARGTVRTVPAPRPGAAALPLTGCRGHLPLCPACPASPAGSHLPEAGKAAKVLTGPGIGLRSFAGSGHKPGGPSLGLCPLVSWGLPRSLSSREAQALLLLGPLPGMPHHSGGSCEPLPPAFPGRTVPAPSEPPRRAFRGACPVARLLKALAPGSFMPTLGVGIIRCFGFFYTVPTTTNYAVPFPTFGEIWGQFFMSPLFWREGSTEPPAHRVSLCPLHPLGERPQHAVGGGYTAHEQPG